MTPPRTIVHLDADAFFAAVEQASDAKLRGKPVAVGGEKRGIIASASYEARQFGVFTPMPTARARKLCPRLIVLPGDFERYEQFSRWMFGYCYDFTPDVEQTSIDEGYFDLTANRKQPAIEIALTIRKAIGQKLKITVSEGIGTNKLVSAVASKLTKPAAFNAVPPGGEAAFLHPLPNKWLPGIGPKTSTRLNAAGLACIRHVAAIPLEMLQLLLGSQAVGIRQFAHGIDDRPLIPAREPQKSFSQQETFAQDLTDEEYAGAVLRRMVDNLFASVRAEGRSIRTLTVKVRYNDMGEDQVSESLHEPTDLETDVYGRLHTMLRAAWKRRVSLRLVSLKLSNVYDGRFRSELPLELSAQRQEARARLAGVIDELRRSRGASVILRGHDFRLRDAPREPLAAFGSSEFKVPGSGFSVRLQPGTRNPELGTRYVPLRVHSHYSFLDSTLSPTAIVGLAKQHGIAAVALTDTGNLHGAVEFVQAATQAGVKPILGAEVRVGAHPLLLYVESARGYHNLCRLLSRPRRGSEFRVQSSEFRVAVGRKTRNPEPGTRNPEDTSVANQQRQPFRLEELDGLTDGLLAVSDDARLAELFPGRFYGLAPGSEFRVPGSGLDPNLGAATRNSELGTRNREAAAPAIHYASPEDRQKYDIVQSIRTLTLLRQPHPEKRDGGRLHFRVPGEMAAACKEHPEWLRHTLEIAERCHFEFPFGKPQFPDFHPPDGSTSRAFLHRLVMEGLRRRYRERAAQFAPQVEEELGIIAAVGYEAYFLVVWEILQECRARGIEWITRGSAADSLVCYCLGISGVCPIRFDLYFKRFLNPERMALNKLPDIDIDFPHDRKDDVVQLLFARHGPEQCAVVGGFSTFQARSAFAEVAKVLGVAERDVRKFTEHFPWGFGGGWVPDEPSPTGGAKLVELLRANPETRALPLDEEPYKTAVEMAAFLDGVPRYPKMHPCGIVLSCQPMHELTPTFISNKGLPTSHYDMDAIETIGLVKMDILAQGGLAVMRDAKESLARRGVAVDLDALEPWEDPQVWEMIVSGGARAVHHIESPAMTTLHKMTNVREIDGLIAIVSVIRPGAANESKKLAFTRRYQGLEAVTYPHPSLEACLRSTYGLVVYEEHILQICESFAGLPAGRADVLRRALVKQKRGTVQEIGKEFAACARARGHDEAKIAEVWGLVTGFSGYAFNKAHSTAYGVEAYQAAWLKRYYPAEFMAGVLTNGKGFYDPLVYVLECHRLGLKLLPPSVNEPGPAFVPHGQSIRVPLTRVKGLTTRTTDRLLAARERGPFGSLADFFHRVAPSGEELEAMIRVGAFDEFGDTRTRQFWQGQHLLKTFGAASVGQASRLPGRAKRGLDGAMAAPFGAAGQAGRGFQVPSSEFRVPGFWPTRNSEPGTRNFRLPYVPDPGVVPECALMEPAQPWLLPPPGLEQLLVGRVSSRAGSSSLPPLREPTRRERLEWETELFGFAVSGHPLELFADVAWDTYCPVNRLGDFPGETVTTCGLVVEQRTHHQITGEPMKFLALADWTGMVETELFAQTYKAYGLATVRYPVLEVEARVEPYENGQGYSLRVMRAGKPRAGPRDCARERHCASLEGHGYGH
ncbi:MAG TPA: DNA polymerase IV [Verrucomicrobiae bacterium]|nr:DNA polymerase IV [Verrucomicrobiae bacterium]